MIQFPVMITIKTDTRAIATLRVTISLDLINRNENVNFVTVHINDRCAHEI